MNWWLASCVLATGCFIKPAAPDTVDAMDASIDSSASGPVTWVQSFVGQNQGGTDGTFSNQARAAGDAVVLQVFCDSNAQPVIEITAAGWTWLPLQPTTGMTGFWVTAFAAIAPDTTTTSFHVTTSASCTALVELGDEFTNNDPTPAAFDAHDGKVGGGECLDVLTTQTANDTLWGACTSGSTVAIGPGFTQGTTDGTGNYSEYKVTSDPAHTAEPVSFSGNSTYAITTVALKRR